jgi:hypothetical protein
MRCSAVLGAFLLAGTLAALPTRGTVLPSRMVRGGVRGVGAGLENDTTAPSDGALSGATRSLLAMPNTHAKPDYSFYLSKAMAMDEIKRIVATNNEFMRVETIESVRGSYASSLTVVTVEPGGFNSGVTEAKTRVLYNYGRAWQTSLAMSTEAIQLTTDIARQVYLTCTVIYSPIFSPPQRMALNSRDEGSKCVG